MREKQRTFNRERQNYKERDKQRQTVRDRQADRDRDRFPESLPEKPEVSGRKLSPNKFEPWSVDKSVLIVFDLAFIIYLNW